MNTDATIQEAVRRIAEQFRPAKVILFGSWARHEADEQSDVDLIVVVDEVKDHLALATQMGKPLRGLKMPCDIVVLSVEEFEQERKLPGLVRVAEREGRVVYERAA
jgi:uncharacterized protein